MQSQLLKLIYGITEATIIACLDIPTVLFIGFSTILVNRFRQCMQWLPLLKRNQRISLSSDLVNLLVGFCLIFTLVTSQYSLGYGVVILGVSASYTALGSISINQKRTSELMALMVESQNSASELPISTTTEYSDLLEDSENE